MPVSVVHLRRWFAGGAIAAILTVAGVYFYARHRVQDALKQVPEKIGVEIKQSATGFTISRSEQGRTLFKIEASKAVQFKAGGRAELHDVAITLYGRDSSRFDHIYGSDFEYDPQSGDVSAKGEIEIDLEANPAGILNPDQAVPKELKNPIHLKTSGLVFNQKTGDAYTKERVEFRLPQAAGSARGITYREKTSQFTLESDIEIAGVSGESVPMTMTADRGTIARNPRQIVLDQARLTMADRECTARRTTVFLRTDNTMDRILAEGEVRVSSGKDKGEVQSDQLALTFTPGSDQLRTAIFSGNVKAQGTNEQVLKVTAGRVIADFAGSNLLVRLHARDNVNLSQHPSDSHGQLVDLGAEGVDFDVVKGRRLDRAETVGAAQITMRPGNARAGEQTVVTAGKFTADFDLSGNLTAVHGGPDARITSKNAGQSDRISSSQSIDANFHPGGGIESVTQEGNVMYADGERKAWGDRARYRPADQSLQLTGSPRIVEGATTTSAGTLRFNRATSEALAEGGVKSTYSDMKPQADGALLASGSPVHVTSDSMTLKGTPLVAVYSGKARLWQDANVIEAPSIEFDRDRRSMVAHGTAAQPVSSVLVQADKSGKSIPVAITGSRLAYADGERKVHLDGNVVVKTADVVITARQMDAFLRSRGADAASSVGKLDKIVASGRVVVSEPGRHATGEQLVYQASEDKFVLTGDSPSIFDAEHGKITGVSLTFYRHDDTVLVEGNSTSPAVTQTRVAR